jgi:hypothetical protein
MGKECSKRRENRNAYSVLVRKTEGKRPLGRPRRRWADKSKMDPRQIGWGCMDWSNLAQDRDHWSATVCLLADSK